MTPSLQCREPFLTKGNIQLLRENLKGYIPNEMISSIVRACWVEYHRLERIKQLKKEFDRLEKRWMNKNSSSTRLIIIEELESLQSKHNRCDECGKQFRTALGFHRHYPRCISTLRGNGN